MIGVFDSGFGGLTVHRALIEALPERDFVYLGDNRNAPYGARPPIDVLNLTCAALERLFAEGCTLAIVACNTASVVALRWIQQQWLPARRHDDGVARNAIGIVIPTIEAVTGIGWHEGGSAAQETKQPSTIAVFATRRTVQTGCYPIEIRKRRPDITVVQQACPELAGSIERGLPRREIRELVEQYVGELLNRIGTTPDSVILGCTHYPLIAPMLQRMLGPGVALITSGRALASSVARALEDSGLGAARLQEGEYRFLCTGDVETFRALGSRFLQMPIEQIEHVQLPLAEAA
jgi:glutamate racemase